MLTEEEYRRAEELLNLQEEQFSVQMKRQQKEIAKLKATRRRHIVQRSFSLFGGVVMVLFGFIDLIVVQSLDANFNNIIIFTLSELIAIPLLRYGLVLFRKMPIEEEISSVVAKLVETQDSIAQVREERLKLIRAPIQATRTIITPLPTDEPLVSYDDTPEPDASEHCPDCGESVRAGSKICRNCGHLFI